MSSSLAFYSLAFYRESVRCAVAEYRAAIEQCDVVEFANGDLYEYPPIGEARALVQLEWFRYRDEQRFLRFVGPPQEDMVPF